VLARHCKADVVICIVGELGNTWESHFSTIGLGTVVQIVLLILGYVFCVSRRS